MQTGLQLLGDLEETHVDWFLANGVEQTVISGTTVIEEGTNIDAIYLLLQGLLGVRTSSTGDAQLAAFGAGEIFGEISYLEGSVTTATVYAIENSLLLRVSRAALDRKVAEDNHFAAVLFRALAKHLSRRLRRQTHFLAERIQTRLDAQPDLSKAWTKLSRALADFAELMSRADKEAIKNRNVVPPKTAAEIESAFHSFAGEALNEVIGDSSPEPAAIRDELGKRVQRSFLPYLLLTHTAERWYSKPRGYAGDYFTIELLYRNQPAGEGRLGPLIDKCFMDSAPAKAVRNRRRLLAEEIAKTARTKHGAVARIASFACGPAAEIFDVFNSADRPDNLIATLLDIDSEAIAFVSDKIATYHLEEAIQIRLANLVYLAIGRQKTDIRQQDLIYSVGLIDYFNDRLTTKIIDLIYDLLAPGGRVILGNFHPRNPMKATMDHVLDWRLIHRTEEDMDRLFQASRFGRTCSNIRLEPEGINLFAECIKD